MLQNQLYCAGQIVHLSAPVVMGILNLTPDSFSDGGCFIDPIRALDHAQQLVAEGAAILDIGAESTRPNAASVGIEEEWQRLEPILTKLLPRLTIPISVDTYKPEIMRRALALGVGMINDVHAAMEPQALEIVANSDAAICVMHGMKHDLNHDLHRGKNVHEKATEEADVTPTVISFLKQRVEACLQAGIAPQRITVDPGFGFGKTFQQNVELFRHLHDCDAALSPPLLVGVSRKRMIGTLTDCEAPQDRIYGNIAAAICAVQQGAKIIRCHEVRPTIEAIRTATTLS